MALDLMALRRGFFFMDAWRRSPRGPYFLCLCKESRQRKHTPGGPPAAKRRVRSPGGNFRKGHPGPYENGAHPCAPPLTGFDPPGLPDLKGAPKSDADTAGAQQAPRLLPQHRSAISNKSRHHFMAVALPLLLLPALGPHLGAARGPGKPAGRRARCAPFSYGTGMCLTKIPGHLADPERAARRARRLGCVSLLLSLHKQRKKASAASGAICPARENQPVRPLTRLFDQYGVSPRSCNRNEPAQATGFVAPHPNPSPGGRGALGASRRACAWRASSGASAGIQEARRRAGSQTRRVHRSCASRVRSARCNAAHSQARPRHCPIPRNVTASPTCPLPPDPPQILPETHARERSRNRPPQQRAPPVKSPPQRLG